MLGAETVEFLGGIRMTKIFMVVKRGKNAKQVATCLQDAAGELGEQVAKKADNTVNLASKQRTTHILQGDKTGGGHLWPGTAGKTPFPAS